MCRVVVNVPRVDKIPSLYARTKRGNRLVESATEGLLIMPFVEPASSSSRPPAVSVASTACLNGVSIERH